MAEFAEQWVDIQLNGCKRMINLQTILYSVIEKKCSFEKLVAFKRATRDEYGRVAAHLIALCPTLTPDKAGEFLYSQMAMTRGGYPMLHPLEKQIEAMQAAEMVTDYGVYRGLLINGIVALFTQASQ